MTTSATSLWERIPVDNIRERARTISLGRALLTLIVGALWLVGWTAAKLVGLVLVGFSWTAAAVVEGWVAARSKPRNDGGA